MTEADRGFVPNGVAAYNPPPLTSSTTTPSSNAMDIQPPPPIEISADVTLKTYLRSIIHMPRCLLVLCVVNLFCWMSLVCYSLYFTDFVGQVRD
jgi:hypothetical protein